MGLLDLFKSKKDSNQKKVKAEDVQEELSQVKEEKEETSPKQEQEVPQKIMAFFHETQGGADLAKMIRTFKKDEIKKLCAYYPINTIDLSDGLSKDVNRFEAVTCLGDILVRYDWTREQDPSAKLPGNFPSEEIADEFIPRIISFIKDQKKAEIAPINKNRLYEFAMALMNAKRYREAIECLKASKPSLKGDDDFWLTACYFNIANISRKKEEINEALKVIKQNKSKIKHLPAQAMDTLNKMQEVLESES